MPPASRYGGVRCAPRVGVVGTLRIRGRGLVEGRASGRLMVSPEPISFYGGIDPLTGVVREPGHPLEGRCVAGTILVFPRGKGSTVGSYVLLRLARRGLAPTGIVNLESEPIVIIGCLLSSIPLMDRPETMPDPSVDGLPAELVVTDGGAELTIRDRDPGPDKGL